MTLLDRNGAAVAVSDQLVIGGVVLAELPGNQAYVERGGIVFLVNMGDCIKAATVPVATDYLTQEEGDALYRRLDQATHHEAEPGEDGQPGRPGDVGPQGIQGDQGIQGVEGPQGLRGFPGEDGEDGWAGRPGDTGTQGIQGEPGSAGLTGATGATGDRGLRGLDGEDGQDGFPGRPGEVGPQGPQGIRGWAEEYVQDDPIPRRVGSAGLREIGLGADDLSTNGTNVAAFAAIAHTHPIMGWRMPAVWPGTANITTSTAVATTTTRALYLGKAHKAITSVTVIYSVTVAAATITWAEVACATGAFVAVGSPTLTNRGYTNVAAVVNTTGIKTTSITTTGIAEGDDLWLLWGNQATTAMQLRCSSNVDDLWTGGAATATARPSTMGAQLFTGGNENIIWCLALFA